MLLYQQTEKNTRSPTDNRSRQRVNGPCSRREREKLVICGKKAESLSIEHRVTECTFGPNFQHKVS